MSVTVTGMKDLQKALKQFPKNVQKNICVGATRAVASEIAKDAKQHAPVRSGDLKRSIKVVKRKTRDESKIRFSIGAGGKIKWKVKGEQNSAIPYYAHMVEFGTSKMAAQPFMRPAFEGQGPKGIKFYKDYAGKRIDKEIAKAKNG